MYAKGTNTFEHAWLKRLSYSVTWLRSWNESDHRHEIDISDVKFKIPSNFSKCDSVLLPNSRQGRALHGICKSRDIFSLFLWEQKIHIACISSEAKSAAESLSQDFHIYMEYNILCLPFLSLCLGSCWRTLLGSDAVHLCKEFMKCMWV